MIFYDLPLNYGGGRTSNANLSDNKYDTTATLTTFTCNVDEEGDGSGTARRITHIFVKFVDPPVNYLIRGHASTPQFDPVRKAQRLVTDRFQNSFSIQSDGFYNDLWTFPVPIMAQQLEFDFTSSVEIAEVMVLNSIVDFEGAKWDGRLQYELDELPRGTNQRNARRVNSYAEPLGRTRDGWFVTASILFENKNQTELHAFNAFRRTHRSGFVYSVDPVFEPHVIAPAIFGDGQRRRAFSTGSKKPGRRQRFTILEM